MQARNLPPVVKWSGSKSAVASQLARMFPRGGRFFDPFVGGGSILPFRTSRDAIAGDILGELIDLWILVRDSPSSIVEEYEKRWHSLQSEGHTAYYRIRDSFNSSRSPHDLLFLSRTCVNGLIRFNSRGDFNNSLHHTRPGISPASLGAVVRQWNLAIQGMVFVRGDYRETLDSCKGGDFVFLDPPYENTRGRYQTKKFDANAFVRELEDLTQRGVRWMLTYDGFAGSRVYQSSLPQSTYLVKSSIHTGLSPFAKVMAGVRDKVEESVYLNFHPPSKTLAEFTEEGPNPPLVRVGNDGDSNGRRLPTETDPDNGTRPPPS